MCPVGIGWANGFRTHHELTMYPLGKCPLAPSVRTLYPVVDQWLWDWALPHQACLTAGPNLTSGYELSIVLSPEDGDRLLGSLLVEPSEEEEESRVREMLPGGFGLR